MQLAASRCSCFNIHRTEENSRCVAELILTFYLRQFADVHGRLPMVMYGSFMLWLRFEMWAKLLKSKRRIKCDILFSDLLVDEDN